MACQHCDHDRLSPVADQDAKTGAPLTVALCEQCGLIQQTPLPSAEALTAYYAHHYRVDYKQAYTPKPRHVYRAGKIALQRVAFLMGAGCTGGNLLDIGAGGGEFVYLSGRAGFRARGIEPNIGYAEYAAREYGSQVETGELNDARGRYDVVTLFHVLEHLRCPRSAFARLYQLLNPEGRLFIEVPWIETNDASPHNIYFRAHLFYFGIDSLVSCASPWFDVERIDTAGNLKVLFRAKAVPTTVTLPDTAAVARVRERLQRKGWFEYLTRGKGLFKPVRKALQMLEESRVKQSPPRTILNRLFLDLHEQRRSPATRASAALARKTAYDN